MLYVYVYHVFKTNGSKVSKDFFFRINHFKYFFQQAYLGL